MVNLGQSFRHILSSRIFRRKNSINHGSVIREYSPGPAEEISTIITSSKASILRLQRELEFSVAALDQIYEGGSPKTNPGTQQNEAAISSPSGIVFHSTLNPSFNPQNNAGLDLSEISITPVSRGPVTGSNELGEILITPL